MLFERVEIIQIKDVPLLTIIQQVFVGQEQKGYAREWLADMCGSRRKRRAGMPKVRLPFIRGKRFTPRIFLFLSENAEVRHSCLWIHSGDVV